jgi:aminopeptidase N
VTDDPHSYSDLSQGRIKHIIMQIGVDFQTRTLRIQAHYQLAAPVTGSLFLDSRALDITSIHSASGPIRYQKDAQDPILGERLHLQNLDDVSAFTIELTTSPDATALQWLEPKQTAGGKFPFLYSQCACLHARSIFPCQDTPSVRFTFEAHLTVPQHLAAVMAAAPAGVRSDGEHKIFAFHMAQPIPSYLFALAVGDIQFKEIGPRTGIYAEPQILAEAAWEFAENEAKLQQAERLFGPYRWDRYDMLIMPPSFPYGGMENPRLTFISPITIIGDRSYTTMVSHELAHAWTGNLVTNATWEDFWINEGWTTYAEYRISEVINGKALNDTSFLHAIIILREDIAAFGPDSERTRLKSSMKGVDPDEVFSRVPYYKGWLFLLSLERAVGREAFDAFIQKYISSHSFQSITTQAFIEFLERELPAAFEVVDVNAWVYQPGLPAQLPAITSPLYDDLKALIAAVEQGVLPTKDDTRGWHPILIQTFLHLLPDKIAPDDCLYFEELFHLGQSRDARLLFLFFRLCIRSEYKDALPGIERFVARVGRQEYITRLFRTMAENEWTRNLARPMFESVRGRYHPITAGVVDSLLTKAGL